MGGQRRGLRECACPGPTFVRVFADPALAARPVKTHYLQPAPAHCWRSSRLLLARRQMANRRSRRFSVLLFTGGRRERIQAPSGDTAKRPDNR
jgi:hypothetical protein